MVEIKTIGLQISGCGPTGFDTFLSVNWPGKDLTDFMPRDDYYADAIAYFARMDDAYQTYEAVICKFEGLDGRHSAVQIAIRIPVGFRIVDRASGDVVSPAVILRSILRKVISENMKSFEDTYEYRGRQIPTFNTSEYAEMLTGYSLTKVWGTMTAMTGLRPIYINGSGDNDVDRKLLCIPFVGRLGKASWVEIGAFSAAVETTALTDGEIQSEPTVSVQVNDKTGASAMLELGASALTLKSDDFGYSREEFDSVRVTFGREDILKAFRNGDERIGDDRCSLILMPSKGVVAVEFNPPLRRKVYKVELHGQDVADRKNEIYEQLSFGLSGINNKEICLEGKAISRFEKYTPEELKSKFGLTPLSKFIIEKVRRDNNTIVLTFKKKESAAGSPGFAGVGMNGEDTVRINLPVQFNSKAVTVVIDYNLGGDGYTTSVYENVAVCEDGDLKYIVAGLTGEQKRASVEIRIGMPTLYKAVLGPDDKDDSGKYSYVVTMVTKKNAIARYMSIFEFKPKALHWVFWRYFTIFMVALIALAGAFVAGVYLSNSSFIADIIGEDRTSVAVQPIVDTSKQVPSVENDKPETPKDEGKADELADKESGKPDSDNVKVEDQKE